jgi:hypothetical protein
MKVKLEYVKNEDKISAGGKPYTRCSIKVKGRYYNGFGDDTTKAWQQGQYVHVDLYEEEYNGKPQYKFSVSEPDEAEAKIEELERRLTNIERFLKKQFSNQLENREVKASIKDEPVQSNEPW